MANLATLITQLRTLARDTPTSNKSAAETPKGLNDGTNTHFKLQNGNLVGASSIWWSTNGSYRLQTGITVNDATFGYITISPAPAVGNQNSPFVVDYYFYHFIDADYTEFLNDASRDLVGNGDPTLVIDGLLSALLQYGLNKFYLARATQYATKYSSSGGQAGQSVDVVTKNFTTLAKMAMDNGNALRDSYYKDLGQREKAASTSVAFRIDPITPPR